MLRYKLRTLLILLAILPPLLAFGWWKYSAWLAEQERQRALRELQAQQVQVEVVIATGGTLVAQPQPPTVGPSSGQPDPPPQPKAPAKGVLGR